MLLFVFNKNYKAKKTLYFSRLKIELCFLCLRLTDFFDRLADFDKKPPFDGKGILSGSSSAGKPSSSAGETAAPAGKSSSAGKPATGKAAASAGKATSEYRGQYDN